MLDEESFHERLRHEHNKMNETQHNSSVMKFECQDGGDAPQKYLVTLFGKCVIGNNNGRPVFGDHQVVEIYLPRESYPFKQPPIIGKSPHWHPNWINNSICGNRAMWKSSYTLVDLVSQLYDMQVWRNYAINDTLNKDVAAISQRWINEGLLIVPLDTKTLKDKKKIIKIVSTKMAPAPAIKVVEINNNSRVKRINLVSVSH